MTPGTVAHQVPLFMGFPSQEYWTELPFPSPGDLLNPGMEPMSPALAGRFFTAEPPGKPIKLASVIFPDSFPVPRMHCFGVKDALASCFHASPFGLHVWNKVDVVIMVQSFGGVYDLLRASLVAQW